MVEIVTTLSLPSAQEKLIVSAIEKTMVMEGQRGDIAVTIITDSEMHEMNMSYRKVDRPTDVLSFPNAEGEDIISPHGFLGDIAISIETAARQAEEYGHTLGRELAFLAVHGTLHILGYDHMDAIEEREMISRQRAVMEQLST